jgi:hypothetical protein
MTTLRFVNTQPLRHGVAKLMRHARSHGFVRAGYSLSQAVLRLPGLRRLLSFGTVEIYQRDVDGWAPKTRIPRMFDTRVAQEADLPELAQYVGCERRVRDRFQRGDRCLVTTSKGKLCAAVWFALGANDYQEDGPELGCGFRFPEQTAWYFDGKGTKIGAWGTLMSFAPEYLRARGVREVFTSIGCNNWQSINSHRSLGFRSLGLIACLGVFTKKAVFWRPHGARWQRLPGQLGQLQLVHPSSDVRV